eukprot:m.21485 g.21485  ORF g.21485 m.21485 type:complete len:109 (+) comp7157_c0_seq1:156-482(+)
MATPQKQIKSTTSTPKTTPSKTCQYTVQVLCKQPLSETTTSIFCAAHEAELNVVAANKNRTDRYFTPLQLELANSLNVKRNNHKFCQYKAPRLCNNPCENEYCHQHLN